MFRGDILSELEFDMSRLETEQGCSTKNSGSESELLSSYGSLPDTLATVACGLDLAAMEPPVPDPVPAVADEITNKDAADSVDLPTLEVAEAEAATTTTTTIVDEKKRPPVVASQTQFGSPVNVAPPKRPARNNVAIKGIAPPRKPGTSPSPAIWEALRSRKVRVGLTLAGVLMIAGLVGLNMKGSSSVVDSVDMELEMSEFGDVRSSDSALTAGSMEAPAAFKQGFENKPINSADANSWGSSPPRLPPLGLSPLNDSGVVPAGGLDRSATAGPRGAWLTGQIELESTGVIPVSGSRSNGFGRR
jgi:hypothetical protein